jgi:hypothetical protein
MLNMKLKQQISFVILLIRGKEKEMARGVSRGNRY